MILKILPDCVFGIRINSWKKYFSKNNLKNHHLSSSSQISGKWLRLILLMEHFFYTGRTYDVRVCLFVWMCVYGSVSHVWMCVYVSLPVVRHERKYYSISKDTLRVFVIFFTANILSINSCVWMDGCMCVCMCVEQVHILVHTYIHIYDFTTHKCKYQLYVCLSVGRSVCPIITCAHMQLSYEIYNGVPNTAEHLYSNDICITCSYIDFYTFLLLFSRTTFLILLRSFVGPIYISYMLGFRNRY